MPAADGAEGRGGVRRAGQRDRALHVRDQPAPLPARRALGAAVRGDRNGHPSRGGARVRARRRPSERRDPADRAHLPPPLPPGAVTATVGPRNAAPPPDGDPAALLLEELEAVGVRLWEDNGGLRYRVPQGVMTSQRLEALRARKDELLELLRRAAAPLVVPDGKTRFEPFPLTGVQAAYLL